MVLLEIVGAGAALLSDRVDIRTLIPVALQLVAASESYEALRLLRGKVKFSVDLGQMRANHCPVMTSR